MCAALPATQIDRPFINDQFVLHNEKVIVIGDRRVDMSRNQTDPIAEKVDAGVPLRESRAKGAQWRNSGLFGRLRRQEGTVQ